MLCIKMASCGTTRRKCFSGTAPQDRAVKIVVVAGLLLLCDFGEAVHLCKLAPHGRHGGCRAAPASQGPEHRKDGRCHQAGADQVGAPPPSPRGASRTTVVPSR